MSEENFNSLDSNITGLFSFIEVREKDEWQNNKDDEKYLAHKKEERKAKENTQKYLFQKRWNDK